MSALLSRECDSRWIGRTCCLLELESLVLVILLAFCGLFGLLVVDGVRAGWRVGMWLVLVEMIDFGVEDDTPP